MSRSLQGLKSTISAFADAAPQGDGIEVTTVTDTNEAQSAREVRVALRTALFRAGLVGYRTSPEHIAIGAFTTDQAAMETQKVLFPMDSLRGRPTLTLVNVAQIADAEAGRRKDHVWVGLAPDNRLAVGYVAPDSPILSRVLPGLTGLWEFETPREWDGGKHFRTRDVLPRVAAGILAGESEVLELLRPVGLDRAETHFAVRPYNPAHAWWPDHIGRGEFNIKTGWDGNDPFVRSLNPGETVEVRFGEGDILHATFARSLQESGRRHELVFCLASSGYDMGKGEVHFCDLMFYGGNAYAHCGRPDETDGLNIRKLEASVAVPA